MPGQERGICEITDELFNDCTLGKMDISENRDEKHCQYDTNEIKMPNHDDSVMVQNQGEVPHNNIKENCTSISEHSSTVDQIQHQSLDNANVSNANKLHGSSSESIIATSIPPSTKRRRNFISVESRNGSSHNYTTGQKNDDSVQTTKTLQKRQRRSQSAKKYDYIGHITSSSDDDIPLANIKFRKRVILEQQDDSDKDETCKPSARGNKTTDTEYSSSLSDTQKQDRNMKKKHC